MPGDRRRGPMGQRRAKEIIQERAASEAIMDETARRDQILVVAEGPLSPLI
jgi:hypothetical protein